MVMTPSGHEITPHIVVRSALMTCERVCCVVHYSKTRLTCSWSIAGVCTKTPVADYHAHLFGFLQSELHVAYLVIDTAYYLRSLMSVMVHDDVRCLQSSMS